jgi:hypothetical protein
VKKTTTATASVLAAAMTGAILLAGCGSGPYNPPPVTKAPQLSTPPSYSSAVPAPMPASPATPAYTASQQQAIDAAQSYITDGQGFSQQGLIEQLDSPDGNGFSVADATFAVNNVWVPGLWDAQAALAAQSYMSDGQGFSCSSLLEQLTSPDGNGFTQAQGEYGVQSVGLGTC